MAFQKLSEIEDLPGADLYWEMCDWAGEGDAVGYRTKGDGPEGLDQAMMDFGKMLENSFPLRIENAWKGKERMEKVRAAVYSLVMPPKFEYTWTPDDLKEALANGAASKAGLVEILCRFASEVNEYWRLRHLVQEAGGWDEWSEEKDGWRENE